jgi:nucleotide-binding universal stress UspA family protein
MEIRRVVVGMDGSPEAARALRWAAREVATRGGALTMVAAWNWDGRTMAMPPLPISPGQVRRQTEEMLATALDVVRAEFPTIPVVARALQGYAPAVLVAAAKGADMLVLGSHGHGRLYHAVLGSLSDQCMRRATCPVVVIPTLADTRTEPAALTTAG